MFVLTPVLNNQTRMLEKEADMFGLNVSRQPDGFAQAAIHLGEYRKIVPGTWKNGYFSIIPAAMTASIPRWCGRARTWSCLRLRLATRRPGRQWRVLE